MRRAGWFLLLAAPGALALEPSEVFARGVAATVLLKVTGGDGSAATAAGTIVDPGRGLVLTAARAIEGATAIEARLHSPDDPAGLLLGRVAAPVAIDATLGLAALEFGPVPEASAAALSIAPAILESEAAAAVSAQGVGHAGGGGWVRLKGARKGAFADAPPGEEGLLLLEHGLPSGPEAAGGPMLDAEARLVGILLGGPDGAAGGRRAAIPANAILLFLRDAGLPGGADLPEGALPVRARAPRRHEAEKAAPPEREPLPAPDEFPYGPYVHYYRSRAEADLETCASRMLRSLRGLFRDCEECGGDGRIRHVIRAGYWIVDIWIPPLYEVRDCLPCDATGVLFGSDVAERAFRAAIPPGSDARPEFGAARKAFVERCRASGEPFRETIRWTSTLRGRFAIVESPRGRPILPLRFMLLPSARGYEWFLHDPALVPPFDLEGEFAPIPGSATVRQAIAGDALRLEDGTIVRLCGIAIPNAGPRLPPGPRSSLVPAARDLVRAELEGRIVGLAADRYAPFTCDGHAIAFVDLDGRDYGLELLRRGVARTHPKHAHERQAAYRRAEQEARKAKAGVWAEE